MQKIRQKIKFLQSQQIQNWAPECETCIKDKRLNSNRITPESFQLPEWDLGPEDLMQFELLPEFPPNGGYENINRAVDVFWRNAFA